MSSSLPRAFGPYLLLARLGKGGSGAAYLARHRDELHGASVEAKPLVVKCLHPRLIQYRDFLKRFRHEADVAVRVSSPHVVRVLDAGRVGDQPYIAMDYVRGWTLSRVNARAAEADVRVAIPLAIELMLQVLQGLVALHESTDSAGLPMETVHRDMAPKNLMVGDDGRIRLIDLGLGKSRAQDWKTDTGTVMGSPGYMAPEQITGRLVDQRADLYAVGVVFHELLTGRRYIDPGPPVDMLRQAMKQRFTPPSRWRKEVPTALDEIVAVALSARPEDRHPTARAFIGSLQAELPKRPGSIGVQMLTENLLGTERRARDDELRRLLGQSDPSQPVPEVMTEIYVRHSEPSVVAHTQHLAPPESAPLSSPPKRTWLWARMPMLIAALLGGFGAGAGLVFWLRARPSPPPSRQPVERLAGPVTPSRQPTVSTAAGTPSSRPPPVVRSSTAEGPDAAVPPNDEPKTAADQTESRSRTPESASTPKRKRRRHARAVLRAVREVGRAGRMLRRRPPRRRPR